MSTYTIRPDAVISGSEYFTPSAGTLQGCMGDNSDATYIYESSAYTRAPIRFGLANPSVAAGEFPDRVVPSLRYLVSGGTVGDFAHFGPLYDGSVGGLTSFIPAASSATTVTASFADSRKYTTAMLADLGFHIDATTSYLRLLDAWLTIYTQKAATAAVTALDETVTNRPTVTVTATADIDSWQTAYDRARTMRVEFMVRSGSSGVVTQGTLIAEMDGEITFSAAAGTGRTLATTFTLEDAIPNGTYEMFARVARQRTLHPGDWEYGGWSTYAALTVNVAPPSNPGLVFTADETYSRVNVQVTPTTTSGYTGTPTIDVERSEDGGVTYTPVRGMTGIAGVFGTQKDMGYDYECPRGVTVRYRTRITAANGDEVVLSSNWVWGQLSALPLTGWNLKCPEDPTLNIVGALVTGAPEEEATEPIGVFRPEGREYPVVVAGTLGGYDGGLAVLTFGETQYAALTALREAQAVLLLQSPFGWQKYIRVIAMSTTLSGVSTNGRRVSSLTYVEVAAP